MNLRHEGVNKQARFVSRCIPATHSCIRDVILVHAVG